VNKEFHIFEEGMTMKILSKKLLVVSLIVGLSTKVLADDPPAAFQSTQASTPGVLGENTAEGGAGVYGKADAKGAGGVIGHADDGRGIYGESKTGVGVWGFSESGIAIVGDSKAGAAGIQGQADKGRGVFGESKTGQGVWGFSESSNAIVGDSRSANAATAVFQNSGGGDLIQAGKNGAFRVRNNGDVFVRGAKIGLRGLTGLTGPQGSTGLTGPQGPAGPVSRAGCICSWNATDPITGFCSAAGGSGRATGGVAECVTAAQSASTGACNIKCTDN
jgi:hypothetical protein